jgi:hypothetical protein
MPQVETMDKISSSFCHIQDDSDSGKNRVKLLRYCVLKYRFLLIENGLKIQDKHLLIFRVF